MTTCPCTTYRPVTDAAKMRAQFLAAGRVNARASDLLDRARNTLTTWVRHLGETRGITFVRPTFIGPLPSGHVRLNSTTPMLIAFLAVNVKAIACDEAAGECLGEIMSLTDEIEQVINPPVPRKFLGRCPTWIEQTRRACGTELECRDGDLQVTCRTCRQTHNTDRLQLLMMNDLQREKLTITQILKLRLPEEYQISERTLRRWRKPGPDGGSPRLKPCGYRRPDGREVINRHGEDDEPLFRWADVTKLRSERTDGKVRA